jgi:hypothetical protein
MGSPVLESVTVPEIRDPGSRTKSIPVTAVVVTSIGVMAPTSHTAEHGTLFQISLM